MLFSSLLCHSVNTRSVLPAITVGRGTCALIILRQLAGDSRLAYNSVCMATNPKVSDARRTTSNGCRMARRVPRKDARCRLTSSYIAAIDFGTTNCSVAYIHPGESRDQSPLMLPIDAAYRVPTAILFDPNGVVKSFGSKARKTYRNLSDNQRLEWAYFEQIKMDLQHDQVNLLDIAILCCIF